MQRQAIFPFPIQLKYERERRAWSQEYVAAQVGCSVKTVVRWEKGETFPRPYYISQLCKLFEKRAEEFGLAPELAGYPLPSQRPQRADQSLSPPDNMPIAPHQTEASPASFQQMAVTYQHIYQDIEGLPPPTHPGVILQREQVVNALYTRLTQPDITAITITGIGGGGKSTLAALVHRHAWEQHHTNAGFFTAEPIWLTLNEHVTIADLLGTLFAILKKPLPDLSNLTPYNQAMTLLRALNTETHPRLIVLDQFEHVLNWQTGYTLPGCSGIGEWIDIINSQHCTYKWLLTSRLWPKGAHEYPPTFLQEYPIEGLRTIEGATLLRKQGVEAAQATQTELQIAVARCSGHSLSLSLLASLLRQNRNLSLPLLLENASYTQLWYGDIAHNLLDHIYMYQCNHLQQKLLFAFAIYRDAVPLEAVVAILSLNRKEERQLLSALRILLMQHMVQARGNALYDLHAIVAAYIRWKCMNGEEEQKKQNTLIAHAKAAQYYLQQATIFSPPSGQRRSFRQAQLFIEAAWHMCQAGQWQEAYHLIRREELYLLLRQWGKHTLLLELYLLLQPSDAWHPQQKQEAEICDHLGRIYGIVGKKDLALHYYKRALQIYEITGELQSKGKTLHHLGLLYESLGQMVQAQEFHEQALLISRGTGNRKEEANSLNGLGWAHHILGHQKTALHFCQQALSIHQSIGNRVGEADTLNALGLIYYKQQAMTRALACHTQALAIRQETGNRGGEGKTLNHLGLVYAHLEQTEKAQEYYTQSLRIRREIGDHHGEGAVLYNLSKLYFKGQQYDVALACLLLARKIFQEGQHSGYKGVQEWMGILQETIGRDAFVELQTQIGSKATQIVGQALAVTARKISSPG
jgi:tetratricopeptide (TPR) repeat protein/transcriptional regulator with XRE-family HTH domain